MKKLVIIVVFLLSLASCEEKAGKVKFRIDPQGFTLEKALFEGETDSPPFSYRLAGGKVVFTSGEEVVEFDLKKTPLEDYLFSLPAGNYTVEFLQKPASVYGQSTGTFTAEPVAVSIDDFTDTIQVNVTADCSLFLVKDDQSSLEQGVQMIERHAHIPGYFKSYPFALDTLTGLYYAYFTPDTARSDPTAFVWFYGTQPGKEEGGLSTIGYEIGYQYYITILE